MGVKTLDGEYTVTKTGRYTEVRCDGPGCTKTVVGPTEARSTVSLPDIKGWYVLTRYGTSEIHYFCSAFCAKVCLSNAQADDEDGVF